MGCLDDALGEFLAFDFDCSFEWERIRNKEEVLGLKRLLHSLTVTSIAAVVLLSANNAVGNERTLEPAKDNVENEPMLFAHNAAPKGGSFTSVEIRTR
jgi:hypothetical protein